mmetsp:Transcript_77838/g.176012  ORF Transcript_77838/g.176012 Transcript_77838/m.176012 type:complete len:287 (-) Transcript_77838:74-934(-)
MTQKPAYRELKDVSHEEAFGPGGCKFSVASGVAKVTFARPDRLNAMNYKLSLGLWKAIQECEQRAGDIRVVVLCAEGRMFCVGADASELAGKAQAEGPLVRLPGAGEMWQRLSSLPQPVIALAQGGAYGGGFGILSCCDIVAAVRDAKFALSEVRLGMIPATISPHVIEKIGVRNARRLFLTGESFDAEKAREFGLVDDVVDGPAGLQAALDGYLAHLTQCAPNAVAAAKRLLLQVKGRPFDAELRKYTESELANVRKSPEVKEGSTALLEKRKKRWERIPLVAKL